MCEHSNDKKNNREHLLLTSCNTDHNSLIPREMDAIIVNLLHLVSFEDHPVAPLYPPVAIQRLLEHLASSWKIEVVDLLYKSRCVCWEWKLILTLSLSLSSSLPLSFPLQELWPCSQNYFVPEWAARCVASQTRSHSFVPVLCVFREFAEGQGLQVKRTKRYVGDATVL